MTSPVQEPDVPRTGPGVAVVTGGTAGIGRATVRELAGAGYDVAVLARGAAGLEATRAEVVALGRRCLAIRCDVSDREAIDAAAERVEDELGPVEVWVNNAFVGALARFWDTTPEEFERITAVTYYGQVNGLRAALRHMRPRDRGSIVNVSSALAHRAIPLQSAYCGAKHAIKGVTESVVTELRAEGSHVTVDLVTLPGVNTPQFGWNLNKMPGHPMPVPPLVQPEVCARMVRYAAEHPRRNSWVGLGTVQTVLGGRVAPWFLDRYLARNGIESQQTDRPTHPDAGSNLFAPLDDTEDRGAHGSFDDQSSDQDPVSALARTVDTGARAVAGTVGVGASAATRVLRSGARRLRVARPGY
ncbi:SDR family oxidoreductase [Nocardioides litoris]|uniref:SDR family oxidoreductase n=1 Tax=Nocardioides litoris TaxID=1926648 RepID=UPI00111E338C|nr:SDR family oxidoreductase [Nocardioides litoris]